jgi:hypothetical protein
MALTRRHPLALLLAPLALAACGDPKPEVIGPTGTTTPPPPTTETTPPEPGCILVDGGGGYASLNDAIALATNGSVIDLCDGVLEEEVFVDAKTVTIVGKGIGVSIWTAPSNTAPINVQNGGNATVIGVTIDSTRNGATVTDGSLTLTDALLGSIDSYGVESTNGVVTLTNVEMSEPAWGGVRAVDSDLSITGGRIQGATTAGVLVEGGTATITNAVIAGTTYVDDGSGSIADGYGVWVTTGGEATISGVTFEDNILAAVFAQNSTVNVSDSTVGVTPVGVAFLGLYVDTSTLTATNVDISGIYQWGVYSFASDTTFAGGTVVADPALSLPSSIDLAGNISLGSMGAIAVDGTMTIRDSTVSGHNSCGVWGENGLADVHVIVEGSVVDNNIERGMLITGGMLDVTDTVISNTQSNDAVCVDAATGSRSCNMAVFAIEAETTFTGGSIETSTDWGFTSLASSSVFDGTRFADNEFVGLFAQDAAITLRGGVVEGGGQYGLYLNTAGALIESTTFRNRDYTTFGENWDGKGGYYTYDYQAVDVYAYDSSVDAADVTFEGTQYGVYAYEAEVNGQFLTFTNVNQPVTAAYATIDLEDIEVNGGGATVVDCSTEAVVTVKDTVVTGTNPSVSSYAYYYADGSLAFSGTSSYSGGTFDGYACDLTVESTEIVDAESYAVYGYDSSVKLDDVSIRGSGTYAYTPAAIYLYHYSTPPEGELSEVEVTGQVVGNALEVYSSGTGGPGLVTVVDSWFGLPSADGYSGVAGYGIELYGAALEVDGIDIAGTGMSGIYALNSTLDVVGAGASATGTISSPVGHGVDLSGTTTAVLADLTITSPTLSGVNVNGATVDLYGVTVTGAAAYGVDCTGVVTVGGCEGSWDGLLGGIDPACGACDS